MRIRSAIAGLSRSLVLVISTGLGACGGDNSSSAANTDGGSSGSSGSSGGSGSSSGTGPIEPSDAGDRPGAESWVWLFTNWSDSLKGIGANRGSFTHVSPAFYTLNYAYASGVADYANCPQTSGTYNCTANGTDNWDGAGLTSTKITQQIASYGLVTVPLIYAGGDNGGTDEGVQAIMNDSGVQSAFITAMVGEAVTKGYGGYNLDWELGSSTDKTYVDKFVSFVNAFKAALAPHRMSLSLDVITANINGTYCSGNNGFVDLPKLQASQLDRIILEAYISTLGGPSSACVKQTASPILCANDVVDLMNIMCTFVTPDKLVMGLDSLPGDSNPIAGSALSTIRSYGITKVALWPDYNSDGSGGSYAFLDANGIVPSGTTWYALLRQFVQP